MRKTLGVFTCLGVLVGGVYPAVVTQLSQILFPHQATGSVVKIENRIVGSRLLGQTFSLPHYFWSRPSSQGLDLSSQEFSGPTHYQISAAYAKTLQVRREAFARAHPKIPLESVPADALMTSGSGLDPHVTVVNALVQAQRVAAARGCGLEKIFDLLDELKVFPFMAFVSEPYINVLDANIALDRLCPIDSFPG